MTVPRQQSSPDRTRLLDLTDDAGTVAVSKLVSKGERLELAADGAVIKLDSLLLESLSWQRSAEGLCDVVADPDAVTGDPVLRFELRTVPAGADTIASEYSSVEVSKAGTDAGEGLRVVAPGRGTGTVLGPATLRELARIDDTFAFSEWFRTPFGPEDTPTEGAI